MKNILITGGAGYIGSHTAVELLDKNYNVIVYDNLSNSSRISIDRVEEITGKKISFYEADILDKDKLKEVLVNEKIDVLIHCAALKSVGESVSKPLEYYHNNLTGTLTTLEAMKEVGCKNLIFSSSATVYGNPKSVPITEDFPKGECTNPYGWSKSMMEQIMIDLQKSDPDWKIVLLRYFNPIGAHKSGKIGEDPQGIPNNLLPYIAQVAVGKLDYLRVFGDDYDTVDGTGVRDYIHVVDLAKGHVCAIDKLDSLDGVSIINLATGNGYSVLEVVKAFEEASGRKVPYKIVGRREGDIAKCFADATKAYKLLGWKAENGIKEMCEDSWRWQKNNPNGYEERK
ncbi:UDP-glucose 4-epimerase GalE [Anaerococcus degeneri]|uniref:UDP-glucose 4-epimerase n=1 Tax=Anaerococcus degeneri TaxID=361500 RepID=A0ABS7Z0N6_9FIRM|nr:UDP-glucose 4-epimerase GalE [Anaerococcus degeneri]MBP2015341.1 UDP-glucose 4-epimerase [Anaerococcus degeneri]MCA2096237.1 UDP-glucose 4-epimerase GalE [Anaerococcus degeneri]